MTPDEIQAALQAAFKSCDAASCPLTDTQKQILLQVVEKIQGNSKFGVLEIANPLDELTSEELAAFLQFVRTQEAEDKIWKTKLLNDWLHEKDSGEVQFIRERYGVQWLNRVQPYHFEKYTYCEDALKLRVGDRIEISNALWEWVQDDGPCKREWYSCVVLQVDETNNGDDWVSNCVVRFYNGTEYEIQGIYEWNRYNWRWLKN
ncbi:MULTISPECIES: hypothetical protein [unclassified Tolypothrix]|uniref:hypothetical protein n=1 Tax=unclassified Tolypothrix TaxID=2649714 RepID=UPI0005EAB623|nr:MULTISPECIES: hypothetical protein [unclassified Tolypothrix]BAY89990.1 hypothetical protein NIES3275_19990 [Microchaete diplosiphon NIES-3275]EKE98768.1 hypothetical protein FDUTEX481_03766 [Tolypothrix sp. PCC 7601]MBE9084902.1 hypothetical protein [Tolypothrix sp. LEGE 11397]UYD24219.1 hypothetical protein HGR01_22380 [Tolypothrix sp. PCC 7712]UYD33553.1 hypothetical protein HG267_32330 [Tolypothrix sp. PCC 7601]